MGELLIGTTSWTEPTLIASGRFYPPHVRSAEQRLRYYASRFPVVEVDSSYYGLPSERNARLWVERTPDRFTFDVKAFRLFTQHQTPPAALPPDIRDGLSPRERRNLYISDLPGTLIDEVWARFRSALRPLQEAGRLGVVLFQFPPWFVYRPSHLDYIAACATRLPDMRIAIEFRNGSWFGERRRQEVLAFERDHRLVHVVADEPQVGGDCVPMVWAATAEDIAVVRLHGRNVVTWRKKGLATAAERFDYLYSEGELRAFVAPIQQVARAAASVHVLFNNCYRDYAQRNALQLTQMVGG